MNDNSIDSSSGSSGGDVFVNVYDLYVDSDVVYEYVIVKSWETDGKSLNQKYFAFVVKIFEDTEDQLTFKISDTLIFFRKLANRTS